MENDPNTGKPSVFLDSWFSFFKADQMMWRVILAVIIIVLTIWTDDKTDYLLLALLPVLVGESFARNPKSLPWKEKDDV